MKLSAVGKNISKAEVTNISPHGLWILFQGNEYFLPFAEFPWFKNATIAEIQNIRTLHKNHLFWPELDVDLSKEVLENLESYPMIWK